MIKHILVTLDGSQLAEQALLYAEDIVKGGGKLTLLSVVDVPEMQVYSVYDAPMTVKEVDHNQFAKRVETGLRDYLNSVVKKLRQRGIDAYPIVVLGDPAKVIIEQAKKLAVDSIVMSTHGRSGISRWLFGSVTQKVLNAMPCPVLVVPGTLPNAHQVVADETSEINKHPV